MGAPKKSLSKMEVNKTVKKILKIHSADQSQLGLSCSPRGVRITGQLVKESGKDFYPKGIENIIRDITSIRGISMLTWELDNWNISGANITAVGEKDHGEKGGKGDASGGSGGSGGSGDAKSGGGDEQERYEIELDILDEDIFKGTGS